MCPRGVRSTKTVLTITKITEAGVSTDIYCILLM